jgi:hypothetical protein
MSAKSQKRKATAKKASVDGFVHLDSMTNAAYHTLTTDDFSIFQHFQRVRSIGGNKCCHPAANDRRFAVKGETAFSAQNEENLLMRMGVLLRSFTSLVS